MTGFFFALVYYLHHLMKKNRKPESFIKKPYFEAGNKALNTFILNNLKYPTEAVINKIEGVVRLRITIEKSGVVSKAKVISGLGFGCDDEAIRIALLLKFKVEAPKVGHIIYHKDLNIPFKLPKSNSPTIAYTTKINSRNNTNSTKNQKFGYTITINNKTL